MTKFVLICLTLCACLGLARSAQAQVRTPGSIGLGVGGGTLARGLAAKYMYSANASVQGNLGIFGTVDNRYGNTLGAGASASEQARWSDQRTSRCLTLDQGCLLGSARGAIKTTGSRGLRCVGAGVHPQAHPHRRGPGVEALHVCVQQQLQPLRLRRLRGEVCALWTPHEVLLLRA